MSRLLVFQHVAAEPLGTLDPLIRRRGHRIRFKNFERHPDAQLNVDRYRGLIVLGGPMNVEEHPQRPHLANEMRAIEKMLEQGKPVLGICLGAQLLAGALGARVAPLREKEIGWFPIAGAPHSNAAAFRFPATAAAFHWHGETFALPSGAVHLARSRACENQAFQVGRAIGLQFHLETTPATARALVENARAELVPGPFVQTEAEILAAPPKTYAALHRLLDDLLAHLLAGAGLRLS